VENIMRKQRSGHIISISSSAGLAAGFDFVSAYAASKFGLEEMLLDYGWVGWGGQDEVLAHPLVGTEISNELIWGRFRRRRL
jgi:hypothetical protein